MDSMTSYGALSFAERSEGSYPTRLRATIDDARFASSSFITNGFSHKGTFLLRPDAKTPLPAVGSNIKLLLHWPLETEMPPVCVTGKVVRQTDDGVGVRFDVKELGT